MIKSMTGYGRKTNVFGNLEISVEIRSVNNRFLDCTVKLPRSCSFAEEPIKKLVKQSISRGKADLFVTLRSADGDNSKVTLNRSVAESYLEAVQSLSEDYGLKNDISVSSLLNLPDLFSIEKQETDEDELLANILSTVEDALAVHSEMRTVEGKALEQDLRSRAVTVLSLVSGVEERSPITVENYRNRLREKMQEVLASSSVDEARILTEAAVFADKIAVDEETVRLRSHFDQMNSMLNAGGVIGRNLDFLLQEMNREANTIGSKGNDIEQARTVVAIKAELEKIREQVQNIE